MYTLEVHERVKIIEDPLKCKYASIEIIDEKVERIIRQIETLDDRLDTAEDKHVEYIVTTNARIEENFKKVKH